MSKQETTTEQKVSSRPPVVVIMGHVDHGKSTLLDYIRKTNITEKEIGGITQHIAAYEIKHKSESGQTEKIIFLDTPGHEAFSKMRERGVKIADIAILVVSAEDGVKTQTIEASKIIEEKNIPYIVALNKIDKPGANVEKTKKELSENGIYLEDYGGKIPSVEISAKTGEGVTNLLSLITILSEMENFSYNPSEAASGFIIEAHMDSRRGIQASLIIKNGHLKNGMFVVAGNTICPVRIMEDFLGGKIDQSYSAPICLVGFNAMPPIGEEFKSFYNKAEAEKYMNEYTEKKPQAKYNIKEDKKITDAITNERPEEKIIIPIILKADVAGSIEAITKEIMKKNKNLENIELKIIHSDIGPIIESDLKIAFRNKDNKKDGKKDYEKNRQDILQDILVVGFNVKTDKNAKKLAEKENIAINNFDIIYKITEWIEQETERRRPKAKTEIFRVKILKSFGRTKERQILGGKVIESKITNGPVRIFRREFEIGQGKIVNLEKNKVKVSEVEPGEKFGMLLESKIEIMPGDIIESTG